MKSRARRCRTLDLDRSSVRLDNLAAGIKSKSDSIALCRRKGAEKSVPDEIFGHPATFVRNFEIDPVRGNGSCIQRECAAFRTHRFDRIDDQILDHLFDSVGFDMRHQFVWHSHVYLEEVV